MPDWFSWVNVEYINRIIRRFQLTDERQAYTRDPFLLFKAIYPVTDVDRLLRSIKLETLYNADPGGTGWKVLHTIPPGKRVNILGFQLVRATGATLTTSGLAIQAGTPSISVDTYAAIADHTGFFTPIIKVKEGWTLNANVAAWLAGDTLQFTMFYEEEDAY